MANPPNVVVSLPKSDRAIPNPPLIPTNIPPIIPKSVLTCSNKLLRFSFPSFDKSPTTVNIRFAKVHPINKILKNLPKLNNDLRAAPPTF